MNRRATFHCRWDTVAQIPVVRQHSKLLQVLEKPDLARLTPSGFERPAIQFRQGHEGDHRSPVFEMGKIQVGDGMALEEV